MLTRNSILLKVLYESEFACAFLFHKWSVGWHEHSKSGKISQFLKIEKPYLSLSSFPFSSSVISFRLRTDVNVQAFTNAQYYICSLFFFFFLELYGLLCKGRVVDHHSFWEKFSVSYKLKTGSHHGLGGSLPLLKGCWISWKANPDQKAQPFSA